MDRDDQLRRAFGNLRFAGEPPMGSTSADDLRRAERHRRRRRRALAGGSGFAAVAATATAVALALPTQPGGGSTVDGDRWGTVVAGSGQESNHDDDVPFPKTRQLLLDTAVEHFDPSRDHLPDASTGALSVTYAATALSWTNPGESGMGLVSGYVTRPGYASSEPDALERFAARLGCDVGAESCTQQTSSSTASTVGAATSSSTTSRHTTSTDW